jgi:hypothetical protein
VGARVDQLLGGRAVVAEGPERSRVAIAFWTIWWIWSRSKGFSR